jgi:hypothetical protein
MLPVNVWWNQARMWGKNVVGITLHFRFGLIVLIDVRFAPRLTNNHEHARAFLGLTSIRVLHMHSLSSLAGNFKKAAGPNRSKFAAALQNGRSRSTDNYVPLTATGSNGPG